MTIEGISEETEIAVIDAMARVPQIRGECGDYDDLREMSRASITALLASGEVVRLADVDELVKTATKTIELAEALDAAIDTEFSEADLEMHYTYFARKSVDLNASIGPLKKAIAATKIKGEL